MKPQYLRIGNYISHTNDNGTFLCKITAIGLNHVEVIVKGVKGEWHLRYNEIKPVKISEEFIRQLGFSGFSKRENEFYDGKLTIQLKLLHVNDAKYVEVYEFDEAWGNETYLTSCYFLHDLQNVLFDNFKELELSLNLRNF